jgi:hypothetical protein
MEVHHHPHVEKKNFKEYFLEFLMIFLAVTMGFFAETIRESISDHAKEKEYIINIKKDLIADTTSIAEFLPTMFGRINEGDTLIKFLQAKPPIDRGADMYFFARRSTKLRVHVANTTTLTELEHSGNFRLISKQPVLKGLSKFQKIIDTYKSLSALESREAEMSYPLLGILFDASVINTMEEKNSHFIIDSSATIFSNIIRPAGNPQLRNYNADMINQLIFYIHERTGSFIGETGILGQEKSAAVELIRVINKEYQLEE